MNANEISENLRSGIYRCVPPIKNGKLLKSPAWDIWHWIVNEDGETIVGKIACIHCFTIQDYKSTSGTKNLLDHKGKCLNIENRKSLAHLSYNEIQTIKSSVNEKVVQFVAQDIRPFRSSSCPGFLALADKLITIGDRYGPLKAKDILPHRTTVSKLVSEDAETKRTQLKSKIVHLQSEGLTITLDLWTEDMTKCHYIGMNVHYISKGRMNEATLCVKELDELSKEAPNIHIEIVNMLDVYGIDINNVIFVTDRGGEIIAALKDYADRLNCAAHILKNIVDEMLNKIGDDNPVKALLENCRRLVAYTKRSGIQYRLPNGLRNEVLSRWNATLFMLESIKLAQETDDLMDILEIREQSDLLTDIDNDLLEEVVDLLKPFLEATLHFEAKKNPTIQFVALHRIDLEEHLTGTPHDSSAIIEMKDHGLNYLQEKWIIDDIQKKAVFFHPKLKKLNMFADGEAMLQQIRREVALVTSDEDQEHEEEEEYVPPSKRRKVSAEDRIIEEFSNSNFGDQPLDEVQQYLNSFVVVPENGKIDLCKYWYENRDLYPGLYKLSLKYLCVPAASATAESKFSLAGMVVNEKRTLLNPSVVDDLMVLKSVFDTMDSSSQV